MRKRIVSIILEDEVCDIHLEIISCEKEINQLINYLSQKYFMKKVFISSKDIE
jgi:hypothetical protein